MMRKLLIAFTSCVLCWMPIPAISQERAEDLKNLCTADQPIRTNDWIEFQAIMRCFTYFHGFLDGIEESYRKGLVDPSLLENSLGDPQPPFCLPPGTTAGAIRDIFVREYLVLRELETAESHPNGHRYVFSGPVVWQIMRNAFPCSRSRSR